MQETERFVPGIARPVPLPRPAKMTVEPEEEGPRWDANPLIKTTTQGIDVEFFMVKSLAIALNRTVHTIFKWEQRGFIPKATYGKKVDGALGGAPRRLYTRAQIEGLIRIAKEEGIYDSRKSLDQTHFAARAKKLFKGDPNA